MMRILHLVSSLDPAAGGVSQAILTIIKGLAAKGVTNEVATIDAPDAGFLQKLPFTVYAKGPGKTAWQYSPLLLEWLKKNVENYDTLIVHGLWQYPTFASYQAWKRVKGKRPKLLVMPHGMLDPYFQRAKERKLKAVRNWLFWKWNEQKLINNADALLFTCETELLLAREPFSPYHPKLEAVVSLGVETPPPYTKEMNSAFNKKLGAILPSYWLFISRIHEKKGVDILIKAYLALKKQNANLPPLVIAGPGLDTSFGKEMQNLANSDGDIHFPGMLSGNAKWGAFYGCEAFILPSHQENFGIAVVEALACGKPVLISDQVNIWREIADGGAGLVKKDNENEVFHLLENWQQLSLEKKAALQQQASTVYHHNFSEEIATEKMLAVLES